MSAQTTNTGAGADRLGRSNYLVIALCWFAIILYPAGTRATALGWSMGIGRLGSVIAPPLLGILLGSTLGVSWNFYAVAIPGLLGALVIVLAPRVASFLSPAPVPKTKIDGKAESP